MAKKTNNRLDDDINLDSFDDFDFDMPDPNVKDDRKPVVKALDGFKEGAIGQAKTLGFYKTALKAALPSSFGQAVDLSDQVARTAKSLYDESAEEIKPTVEAAKQTLAKLVPSESKMLPKRLQDVLRRWKEEAQEQQAQEYSQSQTREAMLSKTLLETFEAGQQADQNRMAEQIGRENLKLGVENARHKASMQALNQSAVSLQRIDAFNTRIVLGYQRKSLELQYRQLFSTQDTLEFLKLQGRRRDEILSAIAKNTALPDAVKLTSKEAVAEMRRQQMLQMTQGALFGYMDRAVISAVEKFKEQALSGIKSFSQDVRSGLQEAQMGAEMADMAGDPVVMAGSVAGSSASQGFANWLGKKLYGKIKGSSLDKRFGISDKFETLDERLTDLPNAVNELKRSRKYDYDDSLKGSFLSWLQGFLPEMGADASLSVLNRKNLFEPTAYTRRTDRSINEVIPGFLSRILREIQVWRTGDEKIGLIGYSQDRGTFTDKGVLMKDIADKIVPERAKSYTQMSLQEIMQDIDNDPNNPMSQSERAAIQKRLLTNSINRLGANQERLGTADQYEDEDPEVAAAAAARMSAYLSKLSPSQRNQFVKRHHHLADYMADPRQDIQSLIDSGEIDLLREQGLVIKENGRLKVNVPEIIRRYLEGEAAQHTPQVDPQQQKTDKLAGVLSAKVSGFKSKAQETAAQAMDRIRQATKDPKGTVDQLKGQFGRTFQSYAQQVQDFKGYTPEQIQELADLAMQRSKQEAGSAFERSKQAAAQASEASKRAGAKANTWFQDGWSAFKELFGQAKQKTGATLDSLRKQMSSPNQEQPPVYDVYVADEQEPRITAVKMAQGHYRLKEDDTVIKDIFDVRGAVVDQENRIVVSLQEVNELMYYDTKQQAWRRLYARAMTPTEIGKSFFNSFKQSASSLASSAFNTVREAFKQNEPGDVYVEGEQEPRLQGSKMAQGHYVDAETGDRISSPADIKGPVKDEKGQQVIGSQDLSKLTFFNYRLRKFSPLWLAFKGAGALRSLALKAWDFQTGFAWRWTKANFRILKKGAMLAGGALGIVKKDPHGDPRDVYVKGESQPRLLLVKMRAGQYLDRQTGQEIRHQKDIRGEVIDREGNTILSEEDLPNLVVFDNKLAKWSPLRLVGSLFGMVGRGIGAGLRFLGSAAAGAANLTLGPLARLSGGALGMLGRGGLAAARGILGITREERSLAGSSAANPAVAAPKGPAGFMNRFRSFFGMKPSAAMLAQLPVGEAASVMSSSTLQEISARLKKMSGLGGAGSAASELGESLLKKYGAGAAAGGIGALAAKIASGAAKAAAPLAAGAAVVGGVKDQMDGKSIENIEDIVPDSLLGKLNPFSYILNAGRLAGTGLNKAYGAASSALGGSGSLGGDIGSVGEIDPLDQMKQADEALFKRYRALAEQQKLGMRGPLNEESFYKIVDGVVQPEMVRKNHLSIAKRAGVVFVSKVASPVANVTVGEPAANAEPEPKDAPAQQPAGRAPSAIAKADGALSDGSRGRNYLTLGSDVKLDGLNPAMSASLMGLAQEYGEKTGKSIPVTDGVRSREEQAQMFRRYGPGRAAPPGSSLHEFGLAVDMDSKTANELDELGLMRKYGLTRPVGREPWHVEPIGIQQSLSQAKQDPSMAAQMVKTGIGLGGGGLGADPSAPKYSRSAQNSAEIMRANSVLSQANTGYAASVGNLRQSVEASRARATADAEVPPRATAGATAQKGAISEVPPPAPGYGPRAMMPTIEAASNVVGIDKSLVASVIAVESGFNPNAVAPVTNAAGLGQFLPSTWKEVMSKYATKYGIDPNCPPTDARANALMTAQYLKDNCARLSAVAGANVGVTEAYLGHFLGAGGASRFLKALQSDPNMLGSDLLPRAAESNRPIFFNNGQPRTLMEIYTLLRDRLVQRSKQFGIEPPTAGITLSQPNTGATQAGTPVSQAPQIAPIPRRGSGPTAIVRSVPMDMPTAAGGSAATQAAAVRSSSQMVGGIDASMFAPTEDLLRQSVNIQTQMRDSLIKLVDLIPQALGVGSKTDMNQNKPQESAPARDPAQVIPRAPISMKRVIA